MLGLYSVLWGKSEEKIVAAEDKLETLTKSLLEDEIRGAKEGSDIP